jgi:hypothetical protein
MEDKAAAVIDGPGANIRVQVATEEPALRPCRFCDAPVPQLTGRVKEFCTQAHRAAYREREHQKAMERVIEVAGELRDTVEQKVAELMGAVAALDRFRKKKTTKGKKDLTA